MTAARALRDAAPTISVGMLTADLLSLGSELELMERAGVKLIHFDVMDGRFAPMLTVGPPLIKAVKTPLLKDVHLMISDPLDRLGDYAAAGADLITVHAEASQHHLQRTLQQIGLLKNANDPGRGILRGVALNPGTPLETLSPVLGEADYILLLAVNPGLGGQSYQPAATERLGAARRMIAQSGRDILLGVDGGITKKNISEIGKTGADIIVTGSAVFDGKSPLENARFMLGALR